MKSVILDALADRGTAAGILRFLQNTSTTASPELGKADGVAQQGSVRKRDGYVPEHATADVQGWVDTGSAGLAIRSAS